MITYKVGNLIDATEDYIAHGCNQQGVMGSGVAKAIRAKWPEAYEFYRDVYDEDGLELGSVLFVHANYAPFFGGSCPIICNCVTQEFYGNDGKQYVDYDAIRECMKELSISTGDDPVAMPKIGAGLAGGDWSIIAKIIEEEIKEVVVYVLNENEIPK